MTLVQEPEVEISLLDEPKHTAVDKAINVLSAFPPGAVAVGVTELAQKLDLPKSTVFRALKVLTRHGLVEAIDGRYRLGHKLFELGTQVYEPCIVLWETLAPIVLQLCERTRQSVALGVLRNEHPVLVGLLPRTAFPAGGDFKMGAAVPAHCTALGKALIAYSPTATQLAMSDRLSRMTPRTIVSPPQLLAELSSIRRTGLSHEDNECTPGRAAVGIALLDAAGNPTAAITIMGRSGQFDSHAAGNALRQARADASAVLRSSNRHNARRCVASASQSHRWQ